MTTNELLPRTMQVLELTDYEGVAALHVREKPLPQPGPGQVLIKMAAAPANPSDLMFVRGLYGIKKPLPIVPGFEGSGVVVAAGPGALGRLWVGRRVAAGAPDKGDGTWAQYMVASAQGCFPLRRSVSLEQGAMVFVNPLTAWALVDIARRAKHAAIVQTAAASALGQMIRAQAQRHGLPVVNVVRRPEQVALLEAQGAKYVLDSNAESFDRRLRDLCRDLKATIAFDAVAGELTGRILTNLPKRGRVVVYGALSEEGSFVQPGDLIFRDKAVKGFWLGTWLPKAGLPRTLWAMWQIQSLIASDFRSTVRNRVDLVGAHDGLRAYVNEMTGGKLLITPNGAAFAGG